MPYLLEMKNITKTFGSVKAIDNVFVGKMGLVNQR